MVSAPQPELSLTGGNTTFDSSMNSEEKGKEEVFSIMVRGDVRVMPCILSDDDQ